MLCLREGASKMDLEALRAAWPQAGEWLGQPEPLTRGTNNLMFRARTATGDYALRLTGEQVDLRRLRFEYDLLTQLAANGLPFALPVALLTADGSFCASIAMGDGATPQMATLVAYIHGEHPVRENLGQATGAGEALALLDAALGKAPLARPEDAVGWRSSGDLARCHPLVPDPRAAFEDLPLADNDRRRLIEDYERLLAQIPGLYASLPRQLSHEDYDPGNVLMVGEHVSGVLDWEFCGLDLRVMDLVVALTWWPVAHFGSGAEWPILAALLRGYSRHGTLASAEVEAIPVCFRLRAYTSLIHRLGRWRQGLSPLEDVVWRARAALEREDWLRANDKRLTQLVGEALAKG